MRIVVGILVAAGLITIAGAQQVLDVTRIGPQVGEQAPAFTLDDQHGRQASLESVMGPKGDDCVLPVRRLVTLL